MNIHNRKAEEYEDNNIPSLLELKQTILMLSGGKGDINFSEGHETVKRRKYNHPDFNCNTILQRVLKYVWEEKYNEKDYYISGRFPEDPPAILVAEAKFDGYHYILMNYGTNSNLAVLEKRQLEFPAMHFKQVDEETKRKLPSELWCMLATSAAEKSRK